jgi:hypothetical protein
VNVAINPVLAAYPRTAVAKGAPMPLHIRRRRRLAALATTAVAAATLQTAFAPAAKAGHTTS